MDVEQPIRQPNRLSAGSEEVLCRPAGEQSIPEVTPEGVRHLADFILLLAKWDRKLTSSQSELLPTTQREAA